MHSRLLEIQKEEQELFARLLALSRERDEILAGTERTDSIENTISGLPKKQRMFLTARLEAPDNRMNAVDLEERVWKGRHVCSENTRIFVWRLITTLEKKHVPLILETEYSVNIGIIGYAVRKK
jgi:hypothetical protein